LFSKTWRPNILFRKGKIMKRVQVPPSDLILPFCIMLTMKFSVLISWTITSPLYRERQATHTFDEYGRSVESYGLCNAESESHVYLYAALIFVVNFSALIFANYQAYLARHLPTDISELTSIGIAMASLLEAFILGAPLLFLASGNPSANFLIWSVVTSISCLAILLPIFFAQICSTQHYCTAASSKQQC
jgi:hypothetical protein